MEGLVALIFDIDGVVVDSNPVHTLAWELYLEALGVIIHGIPARMQGKHNDHIVRDFLGDLSAEEVTEHGAAKERLYRELMAPQFEERLSPGVREFLARFQDLPMAVASNAEPLNVDFVLERSGLGRYFPVVVTGAEVERPKPDPEVYLTAASRLGADPRECIVFEDSLVGVSSALDAGARVVGIGGEPGSLNGVEIHVADFRDPALASWLSGQVER